MTSWIWVNEVVPLAEVATPKFQYKLEFPLPPGDSLQRFITHGHPLVVGGQNSFPPAPAPVPGFMWWEWDVRLVRPGKPDRIYVHRTGGMSYIYTSVVHNNVNESNAFWGPDPGGMTSDVEARHRVTGPGESVNFTLTYDQIVAAPAYDWFLPSLPGPGEAFAQVLLSF